MIDYPCLAHPPYKQGLIWPKKHTKGVPNVSKKKPTKRLAGYGKLNRDMATKHVDDLLGIELTITSVSFKSGEHGEFSVFECSDPNGECHTVISGAGFVLDALHDTEEQNAFPVRVKFYKSGRTVLFE